FSPRSPKSTYSQANKERLRWLLKKDMIHQSVKESVKQILKEKFIFPSDIIKAIKKDKKVWENYQKFSEPYKRIRVAYIQGARKRPGEFNKRLLNFINKTKENKLIGFGGIEKHY
ncbi:MAG: YdeI/OmpD-associated family protein, partial [candidate division WOR-3 bacterium]